MQYNTDLAGLSLRKDVSRCGMPKRLSFVCVYVCEFDGHEWALNRTWLPTIKWFYVKFVPIGYTRASGGVMVSKLD